MKIIFKIDIRTGENFSMGYLFLAIALFAGATKGYCGKMTSGYVNEYKDAMLANTIRMVFCILIGFVITAIQSGLGAFRVDMTTLLISALSGITSSIFVVSWLVSVKKGAYMMMDVFLMLGMAVPLIGSNIAFGESIRPMQWLGLGILMIAVLIMCSYNNSIKGKMTVSSVVLLIVCGISCGLTDFSQKLFVEHTDSISIATFNFYTYIFSAAVLLCFYLIFSSRDKGEGRPTDLRHIFGYILVMSACLFANSYFQTKAAGFLSSAELYPLSKGAGLILSSLMSAVLFKERLSLKAIIGIVLSFGALLIINL